MPEIELKSTTQADKLKELTDKLEQGVKDFYQDDRYKEYLGTMSKFHNYSLKNTMLIAHQNPNATLVAGFHTWKNNFGRSVLKGEKGIKIFAPAPYMIKKEMEKIDPDTGIPVFGNDGKPITEEVEVVVPNFKIVSVFDVSQTDGKEMPTLATELSGGVENYEKSFAALQAVSPAPIEFESMKSRKGYYNYEDKRIAVKDGMDERQNIKTAIHEIAHAVLHDNELNDDKLGKNRAQREIEAESVAYVVCQHYGIDSSEYSFGYVAAWSENKEVTELKNSLENIRSAACEIINGIDENMREREREQDKTKSVEIKAEVSTSRAKHKTSQKVIADEPPKPQIIGNSAYRDIPDKKYTNVDSVLAYKVAAALEAHGVKFSGRVSDNNKTTITVSAADVEKVNAVIKDVKSPEKSITDSIKEKQEANKSKPVPEKNAKSKQRGESEL